MSEAIELEHSLARALDREEMALRYQPILTTDRRIVGLEALLRWRHPKLGLLDPERFIPLAEQSGLIVPIGTWVIRQATVEAQRWREGEQGDLVLSVNISPRQLASADLVEAVAWALAASGSDPATLNLEITESTMVRDQWEGAGALRALRTLGVRMSIDDFGTGYSSLVQLRRLPADFLKIDRSFIEGVGVHPEDTAIVSGVISLARAWGMKVVAEGVETEQQLKTLRSMGCDLVQGNRFSPAMPPESIPDLLAAFRR